MTALIWLYTLSKVRELDKFDLEQALQMQATQEINKLKKQTSVEWLVNKLEESGISLMKDELEMIEEANIMHKEQCVAFAEEWETNFLESMDCKEDLYDKIYKKQS